MSQLQLRWPVILCTSVVAAVLFVASSARADMSTVLEPLCAGATHDNDVFWGELLGHNSFESEYREPFGAVPTDQGVVTLRFKTCFNDVDRVRVRVWNAIEHKEYWYNMDPESQWIRDPALGPTQYWQLRLPIPLRPNILYYYFEVTDGNRVVWYTAKSAKFLSGGPGAFANQTDGMNSFQITVYDKSFKVPNWLKGAVIYQLFPDRFRNGDRTNDPIDGQSFSYEWRARKIPWNKPICDPRAPSSPCPFEPDNQYYGGDLQGVIDKLDYLKDLGVDAIYFNPIFQAATNHRYDTQDHFKIDMNLGDLALFEKLASMARQKGIRLILDGVFNHFSADSMYFDYYHRWGDLGACQSRESPYRDWFFLHYRYPENKARNITGQQEWKYFTCHNAGYNAPYEAWAGYFQLPVLNWNNPEVHKYFYASGVKSVGPYWLLHGANGWRLDVGGLVDRGQAHEPGNQSWENFRKAVKSQDPDAVILGEEWGNATSWLLGEEWDSVMNYRLRSALLSWVFDKCSGAGCANGKFSDTNMNDFSDGGALSAITDEEFDQRIRSIQENYPNESWHGLMNFLGTHDTSRARFLLKAGSNGDGEMARKKLKFLTIFQFAYAGAPTVYYGDEAGVASDDVWYNGVWLADPYNRAAYPWADEGLQPDNDLISHFARMSKLRHAYRSLQKGDYELLFADRNISSADRRMLAFRRTLGDEQTIVLMNRSSRPQQLTLPVKGIPDGAVLEDVLNGGQYSVSNGLIDVRDIGPLWAKILVWKKR